MSTSNNQSQHEIDMLWNFFSSEEYLLHILELQEQDKICHQLRQYYLVGWPKHSLVIGTVKPYLCIKAHYSRWQCCRGSLLRRVNWSQRNFWMSQSSVAKTTCFLILCYVHCSKVSLTSIPDGLLVRRTKIVIPPQLRWEILNMLHAGHQGITKWNKPERCCGQVISIGWRSGHGPWSCPQCINGTVPSRRTPKAYMFPRYVLLQWELPTNIFVWKGSSYLLVVNYFFWFIEIVRGKHQAI